MIKLLNYGELAQKKWNIYDNSKSDERYKVHTLDYKNVISARLEYRSSQAKNGTLDTAFSYLFYDQSSSRVRISEANYLKANRYIIFLAFATTKDNPVIKINSFASKKEYKSITVENSLTYYNMAFTLNNCCGFVSFELKNGKFIVFSWDGVRKVDNLISYKDRLYGKGNHNSQVYLPNKDYHSQYLNERWSETQKIRESIRNKKSIVVTLMRFKNEMKNRNCNFNIVLKSSYFVLNRKSYYYSVKSLNDIKFDFALKTPIKTEQEAAS